MVIVHALIYVGRLHVMPVAAECPLIVPSLHQKHGGCALSVYTACVAWGSVAADLQQAHVMQVWALPANLLAPLAELKHT